MNDPRPLVSLDLETTGTDPMTSRIVEIALCVDGVAGKKWLVNPGVPIPAEATAVHGITDADVAMALPFANVAPCVLNILDGSCDLLGYNLRRLDLPLLDEELRRCGHKLKLDGVRIIDCYGIFAKKHQRRLEDAVRVYCNREHEAKHGALADALATRDVLRGQLAAYPDLAAMDRNALAAFSRLGELDYADLAGKLVRDADGDLRYNFGKSKGMKVREDTGFGLWMLGKDFPGNTLDVLSAELARLENETAEQHGEQMELPF